MKKNVIKLDKALFLNKEIIAQLTEEQLGILHGGQEATKSISCHLATQIEEVGSCPACSCNQLL
jgi:hypothetical protein